LAVFHLVFQKGVDSIKKNKKHPPKKLVSINKTEHKIKVNTKHKAKGKIPVRPE